MKKTGLPWLFGWRFVNMPRALHSFNENCGTSVKGQEEAAHACVADWIKSGAAGSTEIEIVRMMPSQHAASFEGNWRLGIDDVIEAFEVTP
jgi:hypothetical protein